MRILSWAFYVLAFLWAVYFGLAMWQAGLICALTLIGAALDVIASRGTFE